MLQFAERQPSYAVRRSQQHNSLVGMYGAINVSGDLEGFSISQPYGSLVITGEMGVAKKGWGYKGMTL